MYEALADIEALSLSCYSEQSKEYIAESIKCYRSGAYRAAVVSTWIAVVFDLVDKIRELSLSGDTAAIAIEKEFQNYNEQIQINNHQGIKDGLEFERVILKTCKEKLQFFDAQQFHELERLQEDRHRCAHPSFQEVGLPYMPSAELARMHIRNAIVYVLSQPPVQGRAALARLETLLTSDYFPSTVKGAISQIESNGLKKPTQSLIKSFIDKLIYDFHDSTKPLFKSWHVVTTLEAVHTLHTGLAAERISKQINKLIISVKDDDMFLIAYLAGVARRFIGDYLTTASKDKLEVFINSSTVGWAVAELQNEPTLLNHVKVRVSTFDVDTLAYLAVQPNSDFNNLIKARAIYLLTQAKDVTSVNDIIQRLFIPILPNLNLEDVQSIYNFPYRNSEIKLAYGFVLLSHNLAKRNLLSPEAFNKMLNDNNFLPFVPLEQPINASPASN